MRRWQLGQLCQQARQWFLRTKKQKKAVSEKSPWWSFAFDFSRTLTLWATCFVEGSHQFSPLKTYRFPGEVVQVWEYLDKLFVHLMYDILKPTFKAVISTRCYHLKGPSVIRSITQQIKRALSSGEYHYVIRLDIKSYFASIDHKILLQQIEANYDDPKLKKYLRDIITIGIDQDGVIALPKKGIPIRSSLSPFFGALYLKPLDQAFEDRTGAVCWRFMDDVLILFKTQSQYSRAKKRVYNVLRTLKLKISPHKTKMGRLDKAFHFLGVTFDVARTHRSKTQLETTIDIHTAFHWAARRARGRAAECTFEYMSSEASAQQSCRLKGEVDIHSRCCRRALDKAIALKESAVHPAEIKRYLVRWASWWHQIIGKNRFYLIGRWIDYTAKAGGGFELISYSFLVQHNHLLRSCMRRSNESFNPCTAETMSTVAAV